MAVAFLLNDKQEVLLLQKKSKATLFAGFLVPIGGHMEGHEISAPRSACLREIKEETGLKSDDINNLTLRYIILRIKENEEIRIQYVFFRDVSKNAPLIESEEGSLKWVQLKEIGNQNVSATTIAVAKHYNNQVKVSDNVYVGSMKSANGEPEITWGLLEDWELPLSIS